MLTKRTKWFYLVTLTAVIVISMLASPVFAENTGGTAKEGINVHGHWKIEIFNPDGKRVSVTEFDNALTRGSGDTVLSKILIGSYVTGPWGIILYGTPGHPCDNGSGTAQPCVIGQSNGNYNPGIYETNALNLSISIGGSDEFILMGSVTADYASTINDVSTFNMPCTFANTPFSATYSPQNCLANTTSGFNEITRKTLTTPPSVVQGQLIQVTVTISFS